MREPILVINAGSSSIKFSVFETLTDRSLAPGAHGQVGGIGTLGKAVILGREVLLGWSWARLIPEH